MLVAGHALILPVRSHEPAEGLLGQPQGAHRRRELPHQRVPRRLPGEDAIDLAVDLVEQRQAVARRFVPHVVGETREAVDGEQVSARGTRQQAERHREVLRAVLGHEIAQPGQR